MQAPSTRPGRGRFRYTDKSVEALNKAIEVAGVLKGDESGEVTQAAVQEASASLNKAVKAWKRSPPSKR
ncbi:MAG: FIVAR domain-containing protein [Bifidobacterium sp.]